MLLSDRDIRRELEQWLVIEPLEDHQIQAASVDLRLGEELRLDTDLGYDSVSRIPDCGFSLKPGRFILGSTLEYMQFPPGLAGQLAGKSSLGRTGLQVHCTAGFIDPGFRGTLTLELSNLSATDIILRRGQPIGQVCIFRLSSSCDRPYGHPDLRSRYLDQRGPTAARNNME